MVWSAQGTLFGPPVPLDGLSWFGELKASQSNFSLGLARIREPHVVDALVGIADTYSQAATVFAEEIQTPNSFWEGALRRITVNAFERDAAARRACIDHFGAACNVCGFDFSSFFGELGGGFIHVHHTLPLSEVRVGYAVDPKRDLVPVCPNCHAMLHRTSPPLTIEKLRKHLLDAASPIRQ